MPRTIRNRLIGKNGQEIEDDDDAMQQQQQQQQHEESDADDHEENDDEEEVMKKKQQQHQQQQHVLNGVKYSNYPDFVTAKRKRNQKVLNDLGFNNDAKKKKKKKSSSKNNKKKSTEALLQQQQGVEEVVVEEEEEAEGVELPPAQRRLISPSSYYNEDHFNNEYCDDPFISLSFETAAHAAAAAVASTITNIDIDPFDELSYCILRLEQRASKEEKEEEEDDVSTLLKKILTRVATSGAGDGDVDDHYFHRDKYLKAFDELNGIHTILRLFRSSHTSTSTSTRTHSIPKLVIQILRDVCFTSSSSSSSSSLSIPIPLPLPLPPVRPSTIIPVTMMTSIPLASFQNYSSYAEKIATVFVQQEMGLELMLLPIITDEYYYRKSIIDNSISIIVDNNDPNNNTKNQDENLTATATATATATTTTTRFSPRRRSSTTKSVNCGDSAAFSATNDNGSNDDGTINNKSEEDALKTICDVWSIYVNVTYFSSITGIMGREKLLILADTAYWSITTLDYNVTNKLIQLGLIPSPSPSVAEKEEVRNNHNNAKRKGKQKKSNAKSSSTKSMKKSSSRKRKSKGSSDDNDDGYIVAKGDKKKNSNSNSSSSSSSSSNMDTSNENKIIGANIASMASQILEPILGTIRNLIADPIITKRDLEVKSLLPKLLDVLCKEREPQKQQQQQLQVILTQQQEHQQHQQQVVEYDDIIFRWTERDENTIWNVLDVLKICSKKRILSDLSDVERLMELYIRYLKKFGPSSIRIVRCVLYLVDGLLSFVQQDDDRYDEGGELDNNARIPAVKAIIKRSSYKLQLHYLLNKYDCNSVHNTTNNNNNVTEQNKIYEEIQTAISKLAAL